MTVDLGPTRRVGLPVDGRGELPDAATLGALLQAAVDRAARAGLDVELHLSPGAGLPGPQTEVLAAARESAEQRGVDVRVVA
jgi:nucleotide-binding universal stress UspA family protein